MNEERYLQKNIFIAGMVHQKLLEFKIKIFPRKFSTSQIKFFTSQTTKHPLPTYCFHTYHCLL